MSRWFRMYDELLDDPKVQRLSGDDFKAWVNILCLASRNNGALPAVEDIGFALRLDLKKISAVVSRLVSCGLLDVEGDRFAPHGWNARQYKSDVSTDRVKQFRKRKKGVPGNADETFHETAPDTEPDTETDIPVSNDTGVEVEIDPSKVMFDAGVSLIVGSGKSQGTARSWLAKARKDHGTEAVITAIGAAKREGAIEPISYMEASLRTRGRQAASVQPVVGL